MCHMVPLPLPSDSLFWSHSKLTQKRHYATQKRSIKWDKPIYHVMHLKKSRGLKKSCYPKDGKKIASVADYWEEN